MLMGQMILTCDSVAIFEHENGMGEIWLVSNTRHPVSYLYNTVTLGLKVEGLFR
jgi:hypothetical protein